MRGIDVGDLRADDEGERRDAGPLGDGLAHAQGQVTSGAGGNRGKGIEQAHRASRRQPLLRRRHRHGAGLAQAGQAERGRDGNRRLEGVVVPRVAGGIKDDDVVGTVGLLVLADDELSHAGGRLPVDGASIVSGLVVAQRVKGHVGAGEPPRRHALHVQLEAGSVEGDAHGARVHVQDDRFVPHAHAAEQAEGVSSHRSRRPDVDEASVARGDEEHLVPRPPGPQRGDDELAGARTDRQLDDARAHGPVAFVAYHDLTDGRLTGDDALVGDSDRHAVRGFQGNAGGREHERDDARKRARQRLDPLEHRGDRHAGDDEHDDGPPDGRDGTR